MSVAAETVTDVLPVPYYSKLVAFSLYPLTHRRNWLEYVLRHDAD